MTTRTWTIQMDWRCKHCGTLCPGMSGKERESLKCTHCGAEKTDEEWLMPDSAETAPALTGELDRKARAGANWTCAFCKAESRAEAKACEVCSAAKDEAPVRRTPPPSQGPYRATPPPPPWPRLIVDEPVSDTLPMTPWWKSMLQIAGGFIVAALAAVLLVTFFGWLFAPNETVASVAKMAWSRKRRLEERHTYNYGRYARFQVRQRWRVEWTRAGGFTLKELVR